MKQEKNYTCGLACIRYIHSYKNDLIPTEQELEPLLDCTPELGTHPKEIVNYFNNYGYQSNYINNFTINKLKCCLSENKFVILLISIDVPHYVVLTKISDGHIVYFDPWLGRTYGQKIKKFINKKQNHPNPRWFVKPEDFLDYNLEHFRSNNAVIIVK